MHVLLQSMLPTLQQATTDPSLLQRLLDNHRQVSCGVNVPFSWILVQKVLLCPLRVYFPVLCKFWQLYGGVNGDLLQEDLCHTQSQSPGPCNRSLPTHISTGDAQTQFCLSLCGVPGSWCAQDLFEPSEHLWHNWGLILNTNLPLLPSCWGFSFALERGISPHSCFSAYCLTGFFLTLDVGYLHTARPVKHSRCPDLVRGVSFHSCSSEVQALFLTLEV